MRNKNVLIILITLALIVLVAVGAMVFKTQPEVLPDANTISTVDGADSEDSAAEGDTGATELTGVGYVYITASGEGRWFELPGEESKLEITRTTPEGTEIFNVVNLSPEGVFVESASCDNQDCVEQGVVTLENKEERVLRNLIVCLPNEVSVELYSAEEVAQMLIEQSQQQSQE